MRRHLSHLFRRVTLAILAAVSSIVLTVPFLSPAASAATTRMPDTASGAPRVILYHAAVPWPRTAVVAPGQSLSLIAAETYGSASWWPLIYAANRARIHDPSLVYPGQRLSLPAPGATPPPAPPVPHAAPVALTATPSGVTTTPSAPVLTGGGDVGGEFGACVRQRENSDSYSWGDGDGGGAYQFHEATWVEYGGSPSTFGSAGPAEQDRVFMNAVNAGGQSNWSPYDGCS